METHEWETCGAPWAEMEKRAKKEQFVCFDDQLDPIVWTVRLLAKLDGVD
jgi:hypothetical protein